MAGPKQRRDERLRRNARAAPRRRLVGALAGGAIGLLLPVAGALGWLAANGGLEERGLQPEGGASVWVVAGLMLAIGAGFPIGLLGAVLARRLRTARQASWSDGRTAFFGGAVLGLLFALPLIALLLTRQAAG